MTQPTSAQILARSLGYTQQTFDRISTGFVARPAGVWKTVMDASRRAYQCLLRRRRNRAAGRYLLELPDELLDDVGLTREDAFKQLNGTLRGYWHDR